MHSQQLKSSNLKQPVCGKRAVVRSSHVTPEQFRRECGRAHSSPTTVLDAAASLMGVVEDAVEVIP